VARLKLEKRAVSLAPKLGEVNCCCRRRDKPEPVSCTGKGSHSEPDTGRCLEEVASKLIHRIAKAEDASRDTAPLNIQGLDQSAYRITKRTSGSEAVLDREGVEDRTDVSHMQRGCALIQVGSRAAFWDPTYPQY
jgi:hypothetical protein